MKSSVLLFKHSPVVLRIKDRSQLFFFFWEPRRSNLLDSGNEIQVPSVLRKNYVYQFPLQLDLATFLSCDQ